MSNSIAGQAAVNIGHALVPIVTLLAWKVQLARAEHDPITINCIGKILVKSETDLKEAKEETIHTTKQLTNCLKENIVVGLEAIEGIQGI